jgi:putative cytoplasmic protein
LYNRRAEYGKQVIGNSAIRPTEKYTKLPDKKVLSEKLKRVISIAREHYLEKQQMKKEDL